MKAISGYVKFQLVFFIIILFTALGIVYSSVMDSVNLLHLIVGTGLVVSSIFRLYHLINNIKKATKEETTQHSL
ncbi:hypothetical protein SH601_00490 [Gracilibacillus sp. S3-1-1]|uniref:Uncharacterized protein n=1 Tax=Gracilibacillus pellucidus TaxID=3095368 RepID=A0ACC6M0M3_9BACI|nr:hypothetical protein [Gracilibacillus sp. S3-1-1]MDX8044450.1 hypothetical protein [Gracilibacillus sp. S3-1-1]